MELVTKYYMRTKSGIEYEISDPESLTIHDHSFKGSNDKKTKNFNYEYRLTYNKYIYLCNELLSREDLNILEKTETDYRCIYIRDEDTAQGTKVIQIRKQKYCNGDLKYVKSHLYLEYAIDFLKQKQAYLRVLGH